MKYLFLSLVVGLTFLTSAVPAAVTAAQEPAVTHYATAMTELYGSAVPYSGSLDLRVDADGIINGYYFPADYSSMFVPVVGGRNGDEVWFDIGSTQLTHVNGRLQNGTIVGTAFSGANTQFTFVAKPSAGAR